MRPITFSENRGDADRSPEPVTITRSAYACPGGSGMSVSAGQVKAGTSATAGRGAPAELALPARDGSGAADTDGKKTAGIRRKPLTRALSGFYFTATSRARSVEPS